MDLGSWVSNRWSWVEATSRDRVQDADQGHWASPGGSFHRISRGSVLLPEKREITVVAEDVFGDQRNEFISSWALRMSSDFHTTFSWHSIYLLWRDGFWIQWLCQDIIYSWKCAAVAVLWYLCTDSVCQCDNLFCSLYFGFLNVMTKLQTGKNPKYLSTGKAKTLSVPTP